MQIIKDRTLTTDAWRFLADDAEIPGDSYVTVTLQRWLNDKAVLSGRTGQTGVRIEPDDNIGDLACDLPNLSLIEVDFPTFTDGRGFSLVRLLRDKYGYRSEIRAVGQFSADQVFYLSRVGVDTFALADEAQAQVALAAFNDFSVTYQPSAR